ncbi:Hypothetical_protein [Hexamita inflata]|uniref:Hypothetical_protein n=1 Tax=Hexamita inflata TaxID=28002 RepID=A0AA86P6T5_9EUKA|nr:Hypothetical protein HINF_LOCUS19075 [Hexamita inflata]
MALDDTAIYIGGLVGDQVESNATILNAHIYNINISGVLSGVGKDVLNGGVVGSVTKSNLTIFDVNTKNIQLSSTGANIYTSSIIGSLLSLGIINELKISNCNIQSTNIIYNSVSPHAFISLQFQSFSSADVSYSMMSSQSLGFSYINGVRIQNCPELNIGLSNGQYSVTQSGC